MADTMLDAALTAMPTYVVGIRFDGALVLSHTSDRVEADTEVWYLDAPDEKLTPVAIADMTDVSWFSVPKEYVGAKVAALEPLDDDEPGQVFDSPMPLDGEAPAEPMAAPEGGASLDDDQQVDQLTDAELDEIGEAVTAAEERVGQLEGLVASVILSGVSDAIFADDTKQASLAPFDPAALASIGDGVADLTAFATRVAALPAAPTDLPPDLTERIEKVTERLAALEESVGKLMLGDVSDEGLPESEDASTFVDETLDDDEDPEEPDDGEDPAEDEVDPNEDDEDPDDEDPEDEADDESKYPRKKKKAAKGNPFASKKAPPFKGR
jgi:hypothetical protein